MGVLIDISTIIYLFLFSLYHVITGIVSVFFANFSLKFYKRLYGFEPKEKKQLLMTFKPWGNLALAVGLIGFITFVKIKTYYPLLLVFSLLLVIRIWYRFVYRDEIRDEWKISSRQNWKMIILQLIGAVLFFWFVFSRL